MSSPFEKVAAELDQNAKLSANNEASHKKRRAISIKSHNPSLATVRTAIEAMGAKILEGRISTDIKWLNEPDFRVLIFPTGIDRPNQRHGEASWAPEVAMEVHAIFRDEYTSSSDDTKPEPTGNVSLNLYFQTWGRLETNQSKDLERLAHSIQVDYRDLGYHYNGTSVLVRRNHEEPLLAREVEEILAVLAPHIVNYFEIMDRDQPSPRKAGDFSAADRPASASLPKKRLRLFDFFR